MFHLHHSPTDTKCSQQEVKQLKYVHIYTVEQICANTRFRSATRVHLPHKEHVHPQDVCGRVTAEQQQLVCFVFDVVHNKEHRLSE